MGQPDMTYEINISCRSATNALFICASVFKFFKKLSDS
jgi:hypothetical protein